MYNHRWEEKIAAKLFLPHICLFVSPCFQGITRQFATMFSAIFNLGFILNLLRVIFTPFFTAISRILELFHYFSKALLLLTDHFINLQIFENLLLIILTDSLSNFNDKKLLYYNFINKKFNLHRYLIFNQSQVKKEQRDTLSFLREQNKQ